MYNNEACFAETLKIKAHKNELFVDSIHQWHIKFKTRGLKRIINTFSNFVSTLPEHAVLFFLCVVKGKGFNSSHCIKTMKACAMRAVAVAKDLNINLHTSIFPNLRLSWQAVNHAGIAKSSVDRAIIILCALLLDHLHVHM